MDAGILVLTVGLVLIGVLIGYSVVRQRRQKAALRRLAESAGAQVNGNSGAGVVSGVPFSYHYHPGSKNQPPELKVSVASFSPLQVSLRRERAFDRFFKAIGLAVEPHSGDSAFDRRFYVTTDRPRAARDWIAGAEVRAAVSRLFDRGFDGVTLAPEGVTARWRRFNPERNGTDDLMATTAADLAVLGKEAPTQLPRALGGDDWRRRRSLAFLLLGAVAVVAVGGSILTNVAYEPLDGRELFTASLPFSLPLFGLYLASSLMLLRGRSSSHVEWIVAAALAAFAFPGAGYGVGGSLNGMMDETAETLHEVRVVGQRTVSGKSRSYYVRLASWRGPGAEEIEVSSGFYGQAGVGRTVAIVTRPGHFGYEWIVDYRLASR